MLAGRVSGACGGSQACMEGDRETQERGQKGNLFRRDLG